MLSARNEKSRGLLNRESGRRGQFVSLFDSSGACRGGRLELPTAREGHHVLGRAKSKGLNGERRRIPGALAGQNAGVGDEEVRDVMGPGCPSACARPRTESLPRQTSEPNSTSTGVGVFTSVLNLSLPFDGRMRNTAMVSVF